MFDLMIPPDCNPNGVVVQVNGTKDEPRFVLPHVARLLGNKNASKLRERLDPDDLTDCYIIDAMGRRQKTSDMSLGAFFTCILNSQMPFAQPLYRLVCREILPCIFKHGCYPAPVENPEERPAFDLAALLTMLDNRFARLERAIEDLKASGPMRKEPLIGIMARINACLQSKGEIANKLGKKDKDAIRRRVLDRCDGGVPRIPVFQGSETRGDVYQIYQSHYLVIDECVNWYISDLMQPNLFSGNRMGKAFSASN